MALKTSGFTWTRNISGGTPSAEFISGNKAAEIFISAVVIRANVLSHSASTVERDMASISGIATALTMGGHVKFAFT